MVYEVQDPSLAYVLGESVKQYQISFLFQNCYVKVDKNICRREDLWIFYDVGKDYIFFSQ
jgi:hypothetical protein